MYRFRNIRLRFWQSLEDLAIHRQGAIGASTARSNYHSHSF